MSTEQRRPPPDRAWMDETRTEAGWVRRAKAEHRCSVPPTRDGNETDLWRCLDCRLWRLGAACSYCDRYGPENHREGQCVVGEAWRPATLWQRIRSAGKP